MRSIRTLRQWIEQGRLRPGEPLPTDNDLVQSLGVSRTTVRAAVRAIEQDGLLAYNAGRRRIVAGSPAKSGGMVSDTVVILTNLWDAPAGNPAGSQTGWERYVQFALVDSIRKAGRHALILHLDLLSSDLIMTLSEGRPRGLVIMHPDLLPRASMDLAIALRDQGVPVVCYGFTDSAKFDVVFSDNESGSYELTRWLIKSGRRRLLRVWPSNEDESIQEWQRHRTLGYERAIAESGLESLPILKLPYVWSRNVDSRTDFEIRVRLTVGYLLDQLSGANPVDALMPITDSSCSVLAAACRLLGKIPNRDVAIAGYDNYWRDCPERQWEPTPPVATVDKLNLEVGRELMALLQARVEKKLPDEPQVRLIKPKLIVTGPADA